MAVYVFTIAGVAKSLQPGWSISETTNGRNRFEGTILSLDGSYRPSEDDEIVLTEDGVRIFGGVIDAPSEVSFGGTAGSAAITLSISAADFNIFAEYRVVIDGGFPAGTVLGDAVVSLGGWLTDYSVTVDPGQLDGPTLTAPVTFDDKDVRGWFDELSVITGWIWEIDYNKVLRMYEPGTVAAPINIVDGDGHAIGDIAVDPSETEYRNRIVLLAGTGQQDVADTLGTGNGVTTTFPLHYTLTTDRGYVTNGVTNETLGTGATWVYDSVTNSVTRSSAPALGNVIVMPYTAAFPVRVQAPLAAAEPTAEQTARELQEKVIRYPDVFDVDLAQALADGLLGRFLESLRQVRYVTYETGLHPGQTQTITVAWRGINTTCLIQGVRILAPVSGIVRREVTALAGVVIQKGLRELLRDFIGGGGSSSSSVSGGGGVVVSGLSGSGTAGTLAQWTSSSAIGNATAVPASLLTGTIAAARLPQFTGGDVITSGAGSVVLALQSGVVFNATVNAAAAIAWTKISKTGSSLADLTTRSAGDLSSGNLAYARMPSGSGTWTATPTISGALTLSSDLAVGGNATFAGNAGALTYASQTTGWQITAAGAADVRSIFTDELIAKSFIADLEQALAGGQIICKSVAVVGSAFTVPAAGGTATLTVEDLPSAQNMAVFVSGDTVVLRSFSRASGGLIVGDAIGVVTSYADAANGLQTWTFTRNSGANAGSLATSTVIAAKSLALDFGTTGSGFYEVAALDGTVNATSITRSSTTATVTTSYAHGYKSGDSVLVSGAVQTAYNGVQSITVTGTTTFTYTVAGSPATPATGTILLNDINGTNAPYAQIVTWATSPIGANRTVRARFGNLRGITSTNGEYGMLAGTYAASGGQYFRASNSAFELHGIDLLLWDGSTNTVKIDHATPSIALGNPVPSAYGTGTGIWMGKDTSYKFRVGNPSGDRMAWDGSNVSVVSSNLTIDTTGIALATTTTLGGVDDKAYRFTVSNGYLGMRGYENAAGLGRVLYVAAVDTASAQPAEILLLTSAGASMSAYITISSTLSTDSIALTTVTGDIAFSATGRITSSAALAEFKYGGTLAGTIRADDSAYFRFQCGTNGYRWVNNANNSVLMSLANDGTLSVFGGAQVLDTNGDWRPDSDGARHVGVPSKRYAYMTALAFNTSDMVMENGWALTESYRLGIAEHGVALVDEAGQLVAFFGKEKFYAKTPANIDTLKYHVTTLAERLEMDPTPEIRIKGERADGTPIFKTAADVRRMPDPLTAKTDLDRRGIRG